MLGKDKKKYSGRLLFSFSSPSFCAPAPTMSPRGLSGPPKTPRGRIAGI